MYSGRRILMAASVCMMIPLAVGAATSRATAKSYSLVFDPAAYTVKSLTLNGRTIRFRAYEHIVYVQHPVDADMQTMNIYIPVEYYQGKPVGKYTAETAPVFFPNSVGGYMPGPAGSPGEGRFGGADAALTALSRGYVVAEPGARGRTGEDADGKYTGKAPACIVDLKAAVRYLRYNDARIPGTAEKIISNGTSAGGALSALLGASGNNKDYEPYLKALGAADARDDIFAVSAYCPITNLDHADMAYEWLFNGINDYTKMVFPGLPPAGAKMKSPVPDGTMMQLPKPSVEKKTMTAEQIRLSSLLKAQFPGYLNSLKLKSPEGESLSLDAQGDGSFKIYIRALVIASAQTALNAGINLSSLDWIRIDHKKVTDIDFDRYIRYISRLKAAPAFDGLDLENPENGLFGTSDIDARHFTAFGLEHSTASGSSADAAIVKLMNPMNYIGTPGTTTSTYWRIRHGSADRDTSSAIPVMLAAKLANSGYSVDLALPWGIGHAGDYDLEELFAWIDGVCR